MELVQKLGRNREKHSGFLTLGFFFFTLAALASCLSSLKHGSGIDSGAPTGMERRRENSLQGPSTGGDSSLESGL